MNISEPFIQRPTATMLLSVGLFLMGVVAYIYLPVAPLPRVDFPMISVTATLPGADPETVASSLAAPLERRLGQIAGVTEMSSNSVLGMVTINVLFDLERTVDSCARDVQRAIDASASDLPINLPQPPTYRKVNPTDRPIMILAMTSDTRVPTQVFQYADEIVGQRISQLKGVSQVVISGAEKSAVRVQVNPAALAATGESLEDVRHFLAQANVDQPKGSFDGDKASYSIYSNDQLFEASQYKNLVVAQKNGIPIQLRSIANVVDSVENTMLGGWADDKPAVLIIIFKQPDANVINTVDRVKKELPITEKWIPPSVHIRMLSDRTITIRSSVNEVQFSLLLSIALVVMVIFLFLRRFWPTFIASVTVPLSLAGTFAIMYLLHYSVDNLSLMAVTISVGFVVDDAIVVIENVYRFIEEGEDPMPATLKGTRQIGFTIVSMSLSLIAVFIPLIFMSGLMGRLFHEFALTLSAAILVSGVVSLTLTPMLCSRFLKSEAASPHRPNFVQRWSEAGFDWLLQHYEHSLRWVLRHRFVMLVVFVLTILATVGMGYVVGKGPFPQQDTGMISGFTDASQDISFAAMSALQQQCGVVLLQDPAIQTFGSFIGSSYQASTVNNGRFFVTLKPRSERKISSDDIIARLRKKLAPLKGVALILQSNQDIQLTGRSTKAQFSYTLQSADLNELNKWAPKFLTKLREHPQLKDLNNDQQTKGLKTNIVVDRDAAARMGVTVLDVDNTLYDAFGQRQVSVVYEQYNQHHIVLEVEPKYLRDPQYLSTIYVKSKSGAMVPLSAVSKVQTANAFLSVNHSGQFPSVTFSFNLAPGVSLGDITPIFQNTRGEIGMPPEILGSFQGTAQFFQQVFATLPLLLGAALVCVYIVLGMLYESLIHPLTIISTLISAALGALLALYIFHIDLSLVSAIGIILLMGIVKKNGILMVDFAIETERTEKISPEEAIFKACIVRFRPIMMTTMAAILGAVPLAIGMGEGSELRQPLGVSVVGGLLVSQVLTLYTTPVIYLFFEHARQFVHRRWGRPAVVDGLELQPN